MISYEGEIKQTRNAAWSSHIDPWLVLAEVYIYSLEVQTKYAESNSDSFETGYYGRPNAP